VPVLGATFSSNYVPVAAALDDLHMSQSLCVVECGCTFITGCGLLTSNYDLCATRRALVFSLLKLTVRLEVSITVEMGDKFCLLPNRWA
jgi:hypothetical protein